MAKESSKTCFVLSPIGDEASEDREKADKVLKHLIEPATKACGIDTVQRADQIEKSGSITNQIIERILNDDLVVADLSDRNPNVYYELAFRHVIKKPVVHIIGTKQRIPFDLSHNRAVVYDLADWDSLANAKDRLEKQIAAALSDDFFADNPITSGIELAGLRGSTKSTDQLLGEIRAEVSSLRTSLERNALAEYQPNLGFGGTGLLQQSRMIYGFNDAGASVVMALPTQDDLVRLVEAQNAFKDKNRRYGRDLKELGFTASAGVEITMEADDKGWTASAFPERDAKAKSKSGHSVKGGTHAAGEIMTSIWTTT